MGLIERELCPDTTPGLLANTALADPLPWLALIVKPKHECAVHEGLTQKGLESFLPMYWATHRWSDRVKRLQLPLFPSYVFCRFDRHHRVQVLRTPGVRSILSFGTDGIVVPEAEIEQVRRMVCSGSVIEPWPFLKVGQRVRVQAGPLAGLDGILVEIKNSCRVVVGMDLLQRSVAVQLDRDQVTPLNR